MVRTLHHYLEVMSVNEKAQMQVKCPKCGYKMPIFYDVDAESVGIHTVCKGRNCKNVFEVRIRKGKQIK